MNALAIVFLLGVVGSSGSGVSPRSNQVLELASDQPQSRVVWNWRGEARCTKTVNGQQICSFETSGGVIYSSSAIEARLAAEAQFHKDMRRRGFDVTGSVSITLTGK
jgi:ABC-type microcin C transport system duplicated ATPase subunit YejF